MLVSKSSLRQHSLVQKIQNLLVLSDIVIVSFLQVLINLVEGWRQSQCYFLLNFHTIHFEIAQNFHFVMNQQNDPHLGDDKTLS